MADVLVLYQISNEHSVGHGRAVAPSYNAFPVPRRGGVTLASVKNACRALHSTHPHGADGYHWRVRIDEKPHTSHSSGSGGAGYSWWDVQDENARLPVKEATPSELKRMLTPKKESEGDVVAQEVTKAAKGMMKGLGKAMTAVAGSHEGGMDDDAHAPRTSVICFKLLDLGKVHKQFGELRWAGALGERPVRRGGRPRLRLRRPDRPLRRSRSGSGRPSPRAPPDSQTTTTPCRQGQSARRRLDGLPRPRPRGVGAGDAPFQLHARKDVDAHGRPAGETRAEKLKREYAQKQATSNRVWDEVDQRWVEGPVKNGETKAAPSKSGSFASSNSDGGAEGAAAGVKGISLSRDNAAGKSANVQAAVHARINDMEHSQAKAIGELRAREAAKANADAEEDLVRQRLESKLKAWSEEHGKKKQLRALLANLHTILWEGSGWKQVSLADVLDDSKVKRVYFKASRVVHPDKTGHLDAEKRFIAKRVFDALTQAKVEFDEGKR